MGRGAPKLGQGRMVGERVEEEFFLTLDRRGTRLSQRWKTLQGTELRFSSAARLEAGADPNAVEKRGETPLHRAASSKHDAAINLLLEAGAEW